jgi:hypothetical protein
VLIDAFASIARNPAAQELRQEIQAMDDVDREFVREFQASR